MSPLPENVLQILDALKTQAPIPEMWFDPVTLAALKIVRSDEAEWGTIEAYAKRQGINPWTLRKAVEALEPTSNGHVSIPALPRNPPPLAPPLPRAAVLPPVARADVAPWLHAYCQYSAQWSPRAAHGFHEAIGLWVLSTIAARRICVEMGTPVYPVLFLSLVARSTLYAKTTTAKLGRNILLRAGCQHFLAADRSTPQALLRSMSGRVPMHYGSSNEEEQTIIQNRLAFAAQRGWYFEEWGGLLQQMTRRDSPMAEFHGLLRVLDDGYESFSSDTIQRGLEYVNSPYLALLASATPHDLAYFMKPGSPWWHDGFWPRFAVIVPTPGELPSMARRPDGAACPAGSLIEPLHTWHRRLGIPAVAVEAVSDAKGKLTGEWGATVDALPCQALTVASETLEAYHVYNESLLQLIINGDAVADLEASYGRFHDKAMRVAMLAASLAGKTTITLPYWTYGQHVAESWRLMLHAAIETIAGSQATTREEEVEQKIESILAAEGPHTGRDLQRRIHMGSRDLNILLASMVKLERLVVGQRGKTTTYALAGDVDTLNGEQDIENF